MANKFVVTITKDNNNRSQCHSDRPFVAKRGGIVTFVFKGEPEAEIVFRGESPFEGQNLYHPDVDLTIKDTAPHRNDFVYDVRWAGGGGKGNGTGEIIP